jgi:hypothetical protein
MRPRFPHALTVVLTLLAGPVFAAVFIVPPDQELVDSADAIVVGTAVDTQSMFANQDEIITRVFVGVEEVLKGSIDPRLTLEIIVEGGVVGDQAEIVSGAPIFNPGDRYLVFLQRHSGGYWVTYGLSLGRFAFATDSMNRGVLLRSAGPQEIFGWDVEGNRHREVPRGSQRFLRFIRDYLAGQDVRADYFLSGEPFVGMPPPGRPTRMPEEPQNENEATAPGQESKGTLAITPTSHYPPSNYVMSGTFRWEIFDKGGSVTFRTSGIQPGYDSTGAAQRALAAWTNDPGSNIDLRYGGTTTAGFVKDGIHSIVYNSPTDVPAGAIGYSRIWSGGTHVFMGQTFYTVVEADVVMKAGLAVSAAVFEEAVTHEVGHGIAFRHSNEGTPASSDAVMSSSVSGRYGASLGPWDREAASHVYPGSSTPPPPPPSNNDKVGVFRPSTAQFLLRLTNTAGAPDIAYTYGVASDIPIVGDWNGDGIDTPGVYRSGAFLLRNSNTTGDIDIIVYLGIAGDLPVVGDWNGDGIDTVGIFRNGRFFLMNAHSGQPTISFSLGATGDLPVAGDWNGDNLDTVGIFRAGRFVLINTLVTAAPVIQVKLGLAGDKPVVGDWNGDGIDTVGIFRNGSFALLNANVTGTHFVVKYGGPGDYPLAGDWN